MNFDENLRVDASDLESSTQADEVAVTGHEQVGPEAPKRGKKGKYQGQTGPRSKKGKESSRNNCVMIHGLRAKKLLMPFEDPKKYAMHLARVIETLAPQDAVEEGIVDAYAYAVWSSPRYESYQQSKAQKQFRDFRPGLVAQCLGLDERHQKCAPQYLLDIEYEIAPERIRQAERLVNSYCNIKESMEDGDLSSIDWAMAIEHCRELFDVLHEWCVKRGDEVAVYGDDGKTLHQQHLENPEWLWDDLQDLGCFLYFERNFMDLKPQIAVHLERVYWDNAFQTFHGFSDHFERTQNFAFTQLERLARYRKMKEKFSAVQEDDEGD